jgi:SAM-dependent methyltransferase
MPYAVEERNLALVRAIGRPRTVLDVGCGIGLNGRVAKTRGAHVVGIEISAEARAEAARRLDEVLDVDIEDEAALGAALGSRRFELVLCGDVLEHTRDPAAVLRRLAALLEPDGRVVVSLPNVAAWTVRAKLLAGRFEYQDSGILDRTHLRFFTERSARALVADAGLEVLSVAHNPMGVRALKGPLLALGAGASAGGDPTALSRSLPYQLYLELVRPVEDATTRLAPGLLAFQHVLVARKPPTQRRLSLTVGMLTMDEEDSVARMIDEVRLHAPDAEILCVDSSRDRTPDLARAKGARVLRQFPPRGHGPAMELLMYQAALRTDALIYLDCDFTYPPRYLPVVRELLEAGADVVNCARTRSRPSAMPLPNYLANRTFAALARGLHGVPTVDVHSGMRGYRSSLIRAFDFDGEGDALPVDTLLLPAKLGYRVVEIGADYDERVGASKLRKLAGTAWTFVRLADAFGVGSRAAPGFELR